MARSSERIRFIASQPCPVYWAGWRSDTFQLQQAGWQIAAEEDPFHSRIALLMRHGTMNLTAMTSATRFDYFSQFNPQQAIVQRPPEFTVVRVAPSIIVERHAQTPSLATSFRPIDALPRMEDIIIERIEDMKIFATPLVRTEELIVDPRDVSAMLEHIRKLQVPEQERIRAKDRLREAREGYELGAGPRETFHAQVISIADRMAA